MLHTPLLPAPDHLLLLAIGEGCSLAAPPSWCCRLPLRLCPRDAAPHLTCASAATMLSERQVEVVVRKANEEIDLPFVSCVLFLLPPPRLCFVW